MINRERMKLGNEGTSESYCAMAPNREQSKAVYSPTAHLHVQDSSAGWICYAD